MYCVFSGLVTLAFASRLWYREVSCVYYVFSVALLRWLLPVTGGGARWGGGAKIESMLPFDVAYLLLNRGNSGLLGTPVYYRLCSIWGAAAPPAPLWSPPPPPPPPSRLSNGKGMCLVCIMCSLWPCYNPNGIISFLSAQRK